MVMDIFWTQLTILLCLFTGNILFGSLPSFLCKLIGFFSNPEDEWARKIKLGTFLLYIGAGVFISDSLVVLLPKTNQEFTKSAHHSHEQNNNSTDQHTGHHHENIAIPEFIILCSFFLAYVIQEFIFYVLTKLKKTSKIFVDKGVRYCTCAKRHTECSRTFKDAKADQTLFGLGKKLQESGRIPNAAAAEVNVIPPAEATSRSELLRSSVLVQPTPNYGAVTNAAEPPIDNQLPILSSPVLLANERRIVVDHHNERHQNKFLINSILITVGLVSQYIFLGIHLGLQAERFHQFTYLFIMCLQNFVLNFSAGSYLVIGDLKFIYTAIIIGVLSFVSPLGLIFTMIEKTAAQEIPHIAKGIVSAIACGILLYTVFCGMLRQKNLDSVIGLTKFVTVLTGTSLMIGLQYFISTL